MSTRWDDGDPVQQPDRPTRPQLLLRHFICSLSLSHTYTPFSLVTAESLLPLTTLEHVQQCRLLFLTLFPPFCLLSTPHLAQTSKKKKVPAILENVSPARRGTIVFRRQTPFRGIRVGLSPPYVDNDGYPYSSDHGDRDHDRS